MEQSQNCELSGRAEFALRGCVVIVNADDTFARLLQAYLPMQGWSIVVCSGREALRDLRSVRPRAVILDFDGPGMDAYDVLDGLALAQAHVSTRVLVYSHHPEPGEPERSSLRELGVTTWLQRPCSLAEIARALEAACLPVELRTAADTGASLAHVQNGGA